MGRKSQTTTPHRSNNTTLITLIDNLLKVSTTPHVTQPSKALEVFKELHAILGEIIRLQGRSVEANPNREDAVKCFTDWVQRNGAFFKGSSVANFDGYGLGIKAEMDIGKDSLIIAVPRTIMMTVETARRSPLGVLMEKDHILGNMQNVALAMFLLVEKFKGDSFWKPYLDILPDSYTTVLYFDVDDMEALQGSPTLESAIKQVKSIARQFAYFYKLVETSDDPASRILRGRFTYEEYR